VSGHRPTQTNTATDNMQLGHELPQPSGTGTNDAVTIGGPVSAL